MMSPLLDALAETARSVKHDLEQAWPGVVFNVAADAALYGTAGIFVGWSDGPSIEQVELLEPYGYRFLLARNKGVVPGPASVR